jgi:hypothetical protein
MIFLSKSELKRRYHLTKREIQQLTPAFGK